MGIAFKRSLGLSFVCKFLFEMLGFKLWMRIAVDIELI